MRWSDNDYKIFGCLLVTVSLDVERVKEGRSKVEEVDINKVMKKLSLEERMKMRIGLYKGD